MDNDKANIICQYLETLGKGVSSLYYYNFSVSLKVFLNYKNILKVLKFLAQATG